jgi:prepilin-type N-terminal cleavage/methylation domain-containing protein
MPAPRTAVPRSAASRSAARRAFTLIEVLVALSIMSLIMVALYTTLNTALMTRDQLEIEAQVARLGPQILDLVEGDLRRAWITNIDGDHVFLGETHSVNGEPADSLSFLTTVDSTVTRRVEEREISSDVCETGYRLRANAKNPDVMELWRRQSFHVDEQPLEDGVYELVHDRVVRFQVRYLETVDRTAEKLMRWDASEKHALPALVDIELDLQAVARTTEDLDRQGGASRTLHYHRVIPMHAASALLMRIHPLVPTFVGAGAGGGGAADDPDKDTDGDGDPDVTDPDDDNDGIPDADDPSPLGEDEEGGDDDSGGEDTGAGKGNGNGTGGNAGDDFSDALEDLLNGLGGGTSGG